MDVGIIRLAIEHLVGVLVRIEAAIRLLVRQVGHIAEGYAVFLGNAQHVADGTFRDMVKSGDGVLRHPGLSQSHDEFDPDFLAHGNVSFQ